MADFGVEFPPGPKNQAASGTKAERGGGEGTPRSPGGGRAGRRASPSTSPAAAPSWRSPSAASSSRGAAPGRGVGSAVGVPKGVRNIPSRQPPPQNPKNAEPQGRAQTPCASGTPNHPQQGGAPRTGGVPGAAGDLGTPPSLQHPPRTPHGTSTCGAEVVFQPPQPAARKGYPQVVSPPWQGDAPSHTVPPQGLPRCLIS